MVFGGEVMISFNHVMIATRGNWFQTNPVDHDLDNRADPLCVFYQRVKIQQTRKFNLHLLLYCDSIKLKFKTGSGYY